MRSLCTTMKSSPRLPQLEKSPHSNKNPAEQNINKIFLKKRERRGDVNRDIKEKAMGRQRQRLERHSHKLKNSRQYQNLEEQGRILPRAFPGSTPRFLTFSLWNCYRINFYCFNPPSLWSYVMAAHRKLTHHICLSTSQLKGASLVAQ